MTIHPTIAAAAAFDQRRNLGHCADEAPSGAYEGAKKIDACISDAIEGVRDTFKRAGFKADGNDVCAMLEGAIYWFFKHSNPDNNDTILGEGFGEHLQGPTGERVMANCIRDMLCLHRIGAHKLTAPQLAAIEARGFLIAAG